MGHSRYPIHIRFNDLDSYGIVNNAVYLTYFEEGRKLWFEQRVGEKWDWQHQGILLAHHEVDYLMPLLLMDKAEIELSVGKVGHKSFEVHYRILKSKGAEWIECTKGKSVVVCYDYVKGVTMPVPDEWRAIFDQV